MKRRLPLGAAGLVALAVGCAFNPPPGLPRDRIGCYALELASWSPAHEGRLGLALPGHVRLDSLRLDGGWMLLPQERDWDVGSSEEPADSLELYYLGPHTGLRLTVPPVDDPGWGRMEWYPRGYDEGLRPSRARLRPEACPAEPGLPAGQVVGPAEVLVSVGPPRIMEDGLELWRFDIDTGNTRRFDFGEPLIGYTYAVDWPRLIVDQVRDAAILEYRVPEEEGRR